MNNQPTVLDALTEAFGVDSPWWADDVVNAQIAALNIPPGLPVARLRQALDLLERVEGMERQEVTFTWSTHQAGRVEGFNACLDALRDGLT